MRPVLSHLPFHLAATLLTIFCVIFLAGCVAVPIPTAVSDPEPLTAAQLTSIHIGETTREEVRTLFADWTYETDNGLQFVSLEPQVTEAGRYWTFNLRRQLGDVAWTGLAVVPEAPVPIPFLLGKADNYEDFWALFEFSGDATVARYWIAGDKTPCASGGACYHGGYLQLIDDAAPSAKAHASDLTGDRCAIYVYAKEGFELPIVVSDGMKTGWLLGKASFVGFVVASGVTDVSAWYENIPGSVVPMPINCVDGESHYMALRPNKGVLEVKRENSSAGAGAVSGRHVVEHLVRVNGTVTRSPKTLWTNCTAVDPCREVAILENGGSFSRWGVPFSVGVDSGGQHKVDRHQEHHLLLRPGRYTLSSDLGYLPDVGDRTRVDTFDLHAGHRYKANSMAVVCGRHLLNFSSKEAQAQLCSDGARAGNNDVETNWFEDIATKRVVAGQKWCASDPQCPESQCLKQEGKALGICAIPELQCTYDESCKPR